MLTVKYVLKVGKLLDQTGEPRPGFLHDDKNNFEGAATNQGALIASFAEDVQPLSVNVNLEYAEDSETGDVRIVQK